MCRTGLDQARDLTWAVPRRWVLPLAELGGDFYAELKSRSSGYASFDYEESGYKCGAPNLLVCRCGGNAFHFGRMSLTREHGIYCILWCGGGTANLRLRLLLRDSRCFGAKACI